MELGIGPKVPLYDDEVGEKDLFQITDETWLAGVQKKREGKRR